MKHNTSRPAFMLLDAVMGICITAIAFTFAFGFLYTLSPSVRISTYEVYKALFFTPHSAQTTITTHSQPTLTYDILEQSCTSPNTFETLRFYSPTDIR